MKWAIPIIFFLLFSNYCLIPESYLVELLDVERGKLIYSSFLDEGEVIIYKWKNSLFGLNVTETFLVSDGSFKLFELVYEDPNGEKEPQVDPEELDYLCHEGGPFRASNISKRYAELEFMVGKVGKPRIIINDRLIDLEREVGFGGRVRMRLEPSDILKLIFSH
jgi:hypothetical protein